MKRHWTLNTVAGISALLAFQAHGIEAPADDAPPPHLANQSQRVATIAQPFIGIVSEPIPELLSSHLSVNPDEGVLVKAIMPEGPAHKAGISAHDIITHISGTPIRSPQDLNREIQACKPGDQIKVSLIHKGQPTELTLTVGSRPTDTMARRDRAPLGQFEHMGIPDDMLERMRGMIEGNLHRFELGDMEHLQGPQDFDSIIEEMRRQMQQSIPGQPQPDTGNSIHLEQNTSIRMLDQEGSIEITSRNGIRTLTVRDPDHKVIWNGPWTTDEDKAAAPENVRKRVKRLHLEDSLDDSGFKLKLRGIR